MKKTKQFLLLLAGAVSAGLTGWGQSPYQSSSDFARYAMKLRENALLRIEPQVVIPTQSRIAPVGGRYPWKLNIATTVFWIGEDAGPNNPVDNKRSSWDSQWQRNFGGLDHPTKRRGYLPAGFTPQLNPFYFALPYNDITRGGTKPEARFVIPWFRETFRKEGQTVCQDRWIAIRKGNRVCYAQWSDVGPFRTDHWQYVFGTERPKPNLNKGAGLDVSPAVRDFLGMRGLDVADWKFVDVRDVPPGPWRNWGENNHFVINAQRGTQRIASREPIAPPPSTVAPPSPQQPVPSVTVNAGGNAGTNGGSGASSSENGPQVITR